MSSEDYEGKDYSNIVRSLSEEEDMDLCTEGEMNDVHTVTTTGRTTARPHRPLMSPPALI